MSDIEIELIDTNDLMRHFGVTRQTIVNYRKKGLPFIQLSNGFIRYDPREVKEWVKEKRRVVLEQKAK